MNLQLLVRWKSIHVIVGGTGWEVYFNVGPTRRCAFGLIRWGPSFTADDGKYQRAWRRELGR